MKDETHSIFKYKKDNAILHLHMSTMRVIGHSPFSLVSSWNNKMILLLCKFWMWIQDQSDTKFATYDAWNLAIFEGKWLDIVSVK